MMKNSYEGILQRPDIDFDEIRDGRRSALFYYDVDLSVARSVSAGTQLIVSTAGDSIYVDKDPTKLGNATVHFQDVTSGTTPAPVYCEPGFIARVPFTQLLIENLVQPGKIFRFFYGVAIDFVPGASTNLVVSGAVNNTPFNFTRALASQAFGSVRVFQSAVAGTATLCALANSVGSGKTVVVESITIETFAATDLFLNGTNSIGTVISTGTNKLIGGADSAAKVYSGTSGVAASIYRRSLGVGIFTYVPATPIIIPSGFGLGVSCSGLNLNNQNTGFEFLEY